MTFKKEKFALFRGEKQVGRYVYDDIEDAIKEAKEWNKIKEWKDIEPVEVKEYIKKRMTAEQKLKEMMGL